MTDSRSMTSVMSHVLVSDSGITCLSQLIQRVEHSYTQDGKEHILRDPGSLNRVLEGKKTSRTDKEEAKIIKARVTSDDPEGIHLFNGPRPL